MSGQGRRRTLLGAVGFASLAFTPAAGAGGGQENPGKEEFVSNLVIGYSQVHSWYDSFEKALGDDRWELLWNGGAGIESWSDPSYKGWSNKIVSPCKQRSGDPDRVILSVSGGYGENVDQWAQKIKESVQNIRAKYKNVRRIALQAVVGGHEHHVCPSPKGSDTVRAARQHPHIEQAIARVVADDKTGLLVQGACAQVRSCADFKDGLGHLAPGATEPVGKAIADFYAKGKDAPAAPKKK